MPEIIKKIRIFLASPSDLKDERGAVAEVIEELNNTFYRDSDIVLSLKRWETHTAPSISLDGAQSVINKDIGEYDIFIGMLWLRFGTPTEFYGSGTEEEFNIALSNYRLNPNSLRIMFYFKSTSPESIDDLDLEQLSKIRNFKTNIEGLYWGFSSKEELQKSLRNHLIIRIKELSESSVSMSKPNNLATDIEIIEELGVLELQEIFTESIARSTESLRKLTEASEWINTEMLKKVDEINNLVKLKAHIPIDINSQKRIFSSTANLLDKYYKRIYPEVPIIISNLEFAFLNLDEMIDIYKNDMNDVYQNEIAEIQEQLIFLISQTESCIDGLTMFSESIQAIPRMAKDLNLSKSNVVKILNSLIENLKSSNARANDLYIKNLF